MAQKPQSSQPQRISALRRPAIRIVELASRGAISISEGRERLLDLAMSASRVADLEIVDDARARLDRLDERGALLRNGHFMSGRAAPTSG